MVALTMPWLLIILLIFIVIFVLKRKWGLCLGCIVLMGVVNYWGEIFAINIDFSQKDEFDLQSKIKVLVWNVDGSNPDTTKNYTLFRTIDSLKPDIVFLSEDYGLVKAFLDKKLSSDNLKRVTCPGDRGHCFYSRLPVNKIDIVTPKCDSAAIMVRCIVVFKEYEIVLYGVHFSSNNFNSENKYESYDSIFKNGKLLGYFENIRHASCLRTDESKLICQDIQSIKSPLLVLGDMNDVCFSDCIKTLKCAGLKDAWWSGGVGYGATILKPIPYRIDHIMYSKEFDLQEIRVVDGKGVSDHKALYAEFVL